MAKTVIEVSVSSKRKGGFFFHAGIILMVVALMTILPMFLMIPVL